MLFKRKKKLTIFEKIKNFLFPKKGLIRAYKYLLKRLFRLNGNVNSIALGAAFGISIAITPIFGLQLILTLILDIIFKANITASMLFSMIGNPLTFPLIWFIDYKVGNFIFVNNTLNNSSFTETIFEIKTAFEQFNWEIIDSYIRLIIYPMLLGSLLIATIIGTLTYLFILKALIKYKETKLKKTTE